MLFQKQIYAKKLYQILEKFPIWLVYHDNDPKGINDV
jgi:hypothetical protein